MIFKSAGILIRVPAVHKGVAKVPNNSPFCYSEKESDQKRIGEKE